MRSSFRTRPSSLLATVASLAAVTGCEGSPELVTVEDDVVPVDLPLAVSATAGPGASFFRIYDRNIYLGGDTGPLFRLDFGDVPGVLAAVNTFWAQVLATDFESRARSIADEIVTTDPHVVTLQEVARYVLLNGSLQPVGFLDFLPILQGALADRGLDYRLEVRQDNTQGTLPMQIDLTTMAPALLLSFTVGEVTLVRADVNVTGRDQGNYAAKVELPTPLGPVVVQRGWSRVTVDFQGAAHHVVNTHLETQGIRVPLPDGSDVQMNYIQAQELLPELEGLEGVTILTGDLNSDAEAGPGAPSWSPSYGLFTDAGFVDAWTQAVGNNGIGFTCCHDPDLMNAAPALNQRIDFVLVRGAAGAEGQNPLVGAVHMAILGDEARERPASGLWPADHAGLFAGLQIPRGRIQQ